MPGSNRQAPEALGDMAAVVEAFRDLADVTMIEFDLIEYLNRLARLGMRASRAGAAGVLVADSNEVLGVVAASTEAARLLALLETEIREGAGVDCYATGARVHCPDLAEARTRWPSFAPAARAAGYRSVYALPMQRRENTIGALVLFATTPAALGDDALTLGQALADVATVALLNERNFRGNEIQVVHLQRALDSRVLIEQAKGILAERHQVDMNEAFCALRRYARGHNRRLLDVAQAVVESSADVTGLFTNRRHRRDGDNRFSVSG